MSRMLTLSALVWLTTVRQMVLHWLMAAITVNQPKSGCQRRTHVNDDILGVAKNRPVAVLSQNDVKYVKR